MDLSKSYDPYLHLRMLDTRLSELVGEPTNPSTKEVMEIWKAKTHSPPLRTIQYIMDIQLHRMTVAKGMSLLGFKDDQIFTGPEFMNLFHENQRILLLYQTLYLYEIFLDAPELIVKSNPVYCTSRGMRDKDGNYWLIHQTGTPIQYDENGYVVKYYNEYRVLGKYRGEALETNLYTSPEFIEEQKKLSLKINKIKAGMINILGLSIKNKIVLEQMVHKVPNEEILELLESTSKKTIDYHRRKILEAGKRVFPLNDFRNASDVVDYLVRQKII